MFEEFFSSEFFASLSGAGLGSYLAYRLNNRSDMAKQKAADVATARKSLEGQVAAINGAIAVTSSVINTALTLKRQFVRKLVADYRAHVAADTEGKGASRPFELLNISQPLIPSDQLVDLVISDVRTSVNAVWIAVQLNGAVHSLATIIARRNLLLDGLRGKPALEIERIYFGRANASGIQDETYPQFMGGLELLLDDVLYFGHLLQEILEAHGESLTGYSGSGLQIIKMRYPNEDGAMPDPKEYASFEKSFRPKRNLP